MKILIVDDEPDILESVVMCWEVEDVDVLSAPSGSEALDLIDREHPDFLLTDYRMPGMDGLALVAAAHARFPALHAYVMTAYPDPDLKRQARDIGCDDLITKPFDPVALLQRMQAESSA